MNIEDLLIVDLNKACELLDYTDIKTKSRKEDVRSKKHAIIYFIACKYEYFIPEKLFDKIAFFFGMDRSTIYHAVRAVKNSLELNQGYPVDRFYEGLSVSMNTYGVAYANVVCIKPINGIYTSESILKVEVRKLTPELESFIMILGEDVFNFSSDEKRKEYFKYVQV